MTDNNHYSGRPVWAEINLDSIAHNIREIRQLLKPKTRLMAVVKADAYGHGALPVARTVLANGADCLAVAILDEALALRREGITVPILILGYTPPEQADLVVENEITQTVYSVESAQALSAAAVHQNKTVKLHVKIDTGMGRIGVTPEETPNFVQAVTKLPGVFLEGAFTHMSSADEDESFTRWQFARFMEAISESEKLGITIPVKHVANSAATLFLPEMHLDMVRAGIIIYGLAPALPYAGTINLKPAMQLKARVSHVKRVPENTAISYGRRFTTNAPSTIATLPVGYADGWSRLLSNKAEVLIHGKRVPLVGRVCMDQCMLDVTGVSGVQTGDEVVLFGTQADQILPVDEIAAHIGTINYEIVCMISKRVPRVYIEC